MSSALTNNELINRFRGISFGTKYLLHKGFKLAASVMEVTRWFI